ncbi:hypothetical protein LGN30_32045 [Burkholderia seminalis]|uniref:hypothetical protein n=1 Tax=Burkholderia seminalis TaxID=488731 RepID=UPI001CF3DB9B|nr:hypothetical protein [Burkholderia seminalis]MCA8427821.1 hypothetical protein [Burkholderia seminalis]
MNKTLTDDQIDAIANEGHRNAAGGIYATSVYEFARACIEAACQPLATQQPEPRDEVTEEQPSLTNPLTPYGMLVRALRIVTGTLLYDMAKSMSLSPATLSAMEVGRRPVTYAEACGAADFFEERGIPDTLPALQRAIDAARAGGAHE